MFVYTVLVKSPEGKVVYVNEENSGSAHHEDSMMAKKTYPESKGFVHKYLTAEVKRIYYSADEGH